MTSFAALRILIHEFLHEYLYVVEKVDGPHHAEGTAAADEFHAQVQRAWEEVRTDPFMKSFMLKLDELIKSADSPLTMDDIDKLVRDVQAEVSARDAPKDEGTPDTKKD
jgi:hypothetical protein